MLTTFTSSVELMFPGDFHAVYDLASAYHHIQIHEPDQQLLGFAVQREKSDQHDFFVFQRLPFGLATAGQVLDRMLKPVKARIAGKGIRHSIYIDDGHVMATTKAGAAEALRYVYETLGAAGFKLSQSGAATIMWLTDSTNLTCFLEKGSTKPKIQEDILRVFRLARSLQLVLVPIHLLRSDPRIELADAGSKCVDDTDDWSIDYRAFTAINEEYGGKLDVDLFADPENRRVEKYYAKFHCPGSEGTDAFGYSWEGLRAWICPPTGRAVQAIKKIANSRMRGVLVLPAWRSSIFWPLICPDGTHLSHFFDGARVFRPYVVPGKTNDNEKFTLMRGHTPFPFVALFIKSNGNGKPGVGSAEMPKELRL